MSRLILALDLERTLIDDSRSVQPRPGLLEFLTFCQERFPRIVLFTTVEEADAREVLEELDRGGYIPSGLLEQIRYIPWCGEYKDLEFIPDSTPSEVVFVDDDMGWVRPDQRDRWIPIIGWDGGHDSELWRVQTVLEGWLAQDV